MKKLLLSFFAASAVLSVAAQQSLNITQGNVTYRFDGEQMGKGVFNNQEGFSLMGREFLTSAVDMMTVGSDTADLNVVEVSYSNSTAKVVAAGNIARYVDITINGADVTIEQSEKVGESSGEIIYRLSGESQNGSFSLTGSYKATIELHGLTLHNPSGAALNIQNGKRIALKAESGTVNTLSDGSNGSQKGAIVCKGHLEVKGKGELNVTGNTAHAIQAKEYFEMKNATLNILGAVKDGINCAQYFLLESGTLTISGIGDDAIQTDFKDDTDREAEDTGSISIMGGTLSATVTATAAKGLKAEGDISITGGTITISTSGKGMWDASKSKTKAASCLSADGDAIISGGALNLTSTGSGGKGISADGTFRIEKGELTINTSGGVFAYYNGTEYDGYTGNTDRINSDYKSSPKGIKADTSVIISGGNINVTTTGKGAEGIESKGELTVEDGTIFVRAYDDAINSAKNMYINGGDVTVIASANDGLDSNGNLIFNGGVTRAFGANSPECGIDANDEAGYSVIFKGGYVLAVGGGNSVPSSSESTQPYVSTSGKATADTSISLLSGDTELASFTIPAEYGTTTFIAPEPPEDGPLMRPMFDIHDCPLFGPDDAPLPPMFAPGAELPEGVPLPPMFAPGAELPEGAPLPPMFAPGAELPEGAPLPPMFAPGAELPEGAPLPPMFAPGAELPEGAPLPPMFAPGAELPEGAPLPPMFAPGAELPEGAPLPPMFAPGGWPGGGPGGMGGGLLISCPELTTGSTYTIKNGTTTTTVTATLRGSGSSRPW